MPLLRRAEHRHIAAPPVESSAPFRCGAIRSFQHKSAGYPHGETATGHFSSYNNKPYYQTVRSMYNIYI